MLSGIINFDISSITVSVKMGSPSVKPPLKNYFVSIIFLLLSVKSHVLAGIKPDFYFLIIYYYRKLLHYQINYINLLSD